MTQKEVRREVGDKGSIHFQGDHFWLHLDAETEMEFVRIPAGEFRMGSNDKDLTDKDITDSWSHKQIIKFSYEMPQHKVYLEEYWMGKYPVINRQYRAFMLAQKYAAPQHWKTGQIPPGQEDCPVSYVSWDDSVKFCDWLNSLVRSAPAVQGTSVRFHLPSEAEWEKAARGQDGRFYPWGDQKPDKKLCNFASNAGKLTPVGFYSPKGDSPYGCADMAGNVLEWVADWYTEDYYAKSPAKNPTGSASGELKVLRGGSWITHWLCCRVTHRLGAGPSAVDYSAGFRCAASLH